MFDAVIASVLVDLNFVRAGLVFELHGNLREGIRLQSFPIVLFCKTTVK